MKKPKKLYRALNVKKPKLYERYIAQVKPANIIVKDNT